MKHAWRRDRPGSGPAQARQVGHRRLATVLVVALLAAGVLAGTVIADSQHNRRVTIAERFNTRHTTASRFIEAYLDLVIKHETQLAQAVFMGKMTQARFDEITQQNQFSTAVLLDDHKRLLALSPADPSLLGDRLDPKDPSLLSALSGTPAISNVIVPGSGRTPVIGFSVPFDTPTGRRVFAGGYPISDTPLQPFVAGALPSYHTAHTYLVDPTGIVISADRPANVGKSLRSVDTPVATAMTGRGSGFTGKGAQRQYYVTGTIDGTAWQLVFTLDASELFASLTRSQRWTPWLALLGFVLMGLGIIALLTRALTGRAQAEDDHDRQESILDTASDAFIGLDERGLVTEWNTAATRLLGWTQEQALGEPASMLIVPPKDRDAYAAVLKQFLDTGVSHLPEHAITLTAQHQGGRQIPVELTVSRTQWHGSWRFHAFIRDISDRLEHERQLQELALTDSLTGLANRRAFMVNLEQAHARASRHGSELVVVYADVDEFKSINDSFGHAAGDAILVQIADRLRAQFRTEDTIGRLGGDEFAVICEDFTSSSQGLAERLRDVLAAPYTFRSEPILATVSVGLAARQGDESVEHLLERADMTMYRAKAAQRS
jgi:diguanylate cyclase (GGDEF)-like protein/PAS domain S-box-containing protein